MAMIISGDSGITFPNGSTQQTAAPLPPGVVLHFANNVAPAGWLECNGAAVSRTEYAALFAAIGTLYGVGNGTSTFNLPDLRGEFIRGWDNGRGVDPGRNIGTSQADEFKSHTHTPPSGYQYVTTPFSGDGNIDSSTVTGSSERNAAAVASAATGGNETRPRNVALMPCIKT